MNILDIINLNIQRQIHQKMSPKESLARSEFREFKRVLQSRVCRTRKW